MRFVSFPTLLFHCIAIGGCAGPTRIIQSKIDQFKQEHPERIMVYQGTKKSIRYAWSGSPEKQPLLFVHGSPGSWEGWSHFLLDPELQKNFHVIAVDRLGYGGSDPGNAELSLASQADAILEVLKINHSRVPAILIGHSFGGPVIARAAMDHPDLLGGLIFVASSVAPELEQVKWMQLPATWWPIRVLLPNHLRVCNEEILGLKTELTSMLPLWKNIAAKVILIQGEKDDLVPPQNLDFLVAHLRHENIVKVVRVADLNHFVPWKRPDIIFDSIREITH